MNSDVFREQMEFLVAAGYQTVSVSDVARAIRVGAELPANPIALTFDDGNADTFDLAYPILDSMDLRGVAYVVANRTGAEGFMSETDLQALSAAGWEIGSHSMSHVDLTQGGPTLWRQEILASRLDLEAVLGVPVLSFAYPFGMSTPEIIAKVAEYGYDSAAGLGPSRVNDRGNLYYLQRREVWGTWSEEQFEAVLRGDGG
jgi:peptidoglycan/xylan/chitin deacetylase (PgdA/CDA1 family)